ncbi:hypothetical protein AB6H26_14580 [Providencia hangzhouensis]|uniref:Uncharacterized protein n=1 Tax=Providencia rettgeri TaxID=587 RepID=A0A9N8GYD6_PRORE|nr:hypothetical protein [Providencia rettgeri]CAB5646036.1 Uncharacterised protein [Providencia rettgeri]CAB5712898.1 Uncharacterised protein [Providencia rettgeri]CAC9220269.1 Uncharacterised protein [Providencia rettgeri]CAC9269394.1 Uncharacterised protein [Providencia rettgeri]
MNTTLIRYAITAVAGALIVGGLSALMATNIMQSKIDDEIKARQAMALEFEQAQRTTAESNTDALKQLVHQQQEQLKKNVEISNQVYDELKKITMAASRIEQQIPDALAQDGDHYTGLGANGLRLYLSAFGYGSGSGGNFRVPTAPERLITTPTKTATPAIGQAGSPTQARQGLRPMEPKPRSQVDGVTEVGHRNTQDEP